MSFLLDTNVLSDWVKPQPDPGMAQWIAEADEASLFISVITLAELRRAIERMAPGRRRDRMRNWLDADLADRFEDRICDIDSEVAKVWGRITAQRERAGRPIGPMHAFIAAIAAQRGFAVVTRNVVDFADIAVEVVNPWSTT